MESYRTILFRSMDKWLSHFKRYRASPWCRSECYFVLTCDSKILRKIKKNRRSLGLISCFCGWKELCETVMVFSISFHESICVLIKMKGHWSGLPCHINQKKKIAVAVMLKKMTWKLCNISLSNENVETAILLNLSRKHDRYITN